jgi:hypothetical protein
VGTLTNLLGRWWPGNYIDPTEQAMWEGAANLADVGELTALWLEGRIEHQAAYCSAVDVDEDGVPGLAALLAACCRAGLVTHQSQAGFAGVGYDGNWWEQRAAVEAFTTDDVLEHLTEMATAAGLSIQAGRAGRRTNNREAVDVTLCAGQAITGFGVILSRSHLADEWTGYGICQPPAVEEIIQAWQVLVYDPEWGRNDRLWPALARFVEG